MILGSIPASDSLNPLPIGIGMSWPHLTPPLGWLICDGQEVNRIQYADLFSIIGSTYGIGDGSTTFNLPDCKGRTLVGSDTMGSASANRLTSDNTLGSKEGSSTHSLSESEMVTHSHDFTVSPHSHNDVNSHTHDRKTYTSSQEAGGYAVVGGAGIYFPGRVMVTGSSADVTLSSYHSASINNAISGISSEPVGNGAPHPNLQPYIVINHIIYAGI